MTRDGKTSQSLAQHIRELSAEVAGLKEAGAETLTDTLAHWLAAHYVVAAKSAAREAGASGIDLSTLRGLSADVVALRRGDHYAERLRIERAHLELDREQSKERMEMRFWEWAEKPENKGRICDRGLSAEEKTARIREIFGVTRPPEPSPAAGLSPKGPGTMDEALHIL